LTFDNKDNWNDAPFMQQHQPGDPMAVRNYKQHYGYDKVGNIIYMEHKAAGNNWIRTYEYETANNRLRFTTVGSQTYLYPHHAQHGFITAMPHLDEMGWNFKEELIKSIRQKVNAGNGTAETTWYQYDGSGQRIRKITENSALQDAIPTRKDERIYIVGYETYKTYQANTLNFERESLSLMEEGHRFVMIETVKQNMNPAPPPWEGVGGRTIRYQLHNHLGSAVLELDTTAQVISYEEYHPYGTTAYQAKNAAIKSTAKRYRYTGMERDEETGLEYHSARYYLPWLGRWLSADPKGIEGGQNVFGYANDSPTTFIDQTGTTPEWLKNLKNTVSPIAEGVVTRAKEKIDETVEAIDETVEAIREDPLAIVHPGLALSLKAATELYVRENVSKSNEVLVKGLAAQLKPVKEVGEGAGDLAYGVANPERISGKAMGRAAVDVLAPIVVYGVGRVVGKVVGKVKAPSNGPRPQKPEVTPKSSYDTKKAPVKGKSSGDSTSRRTTLKDSGLSPEAQRIYTSIRKAGFSHQEAMKSLRDLARMEKQLPESAAGPGPNAGSNTTTPNDRLGGNKPDSTYGKRRAKQSETGTGQIYD